MTHEFSETHSIQKNSVVSPHKYKLLRDDAEFSAFLVQSAESIADMQWSTVNPDQLPIEQFREVSPFRQFNVDIVERYRLDLPPVNSRIEDAYLAAAQRADETNGSWTVYFTTGTTTEPITVPGTVFVNGVRKYAEIKIAANVPVMIRHNKRPVGEHYAMDVSALLFQTQNPDQQHVPILDLVNKDGSRAHLASTGSSNSRWPSVSRIGGNKKA